TPCLSETSQGRVDRCEHLRELAIDQLAIGPRRRLACEPDREGDERLDALGGGDERDEGAFELGPAASLPHQGEELDVARKARGGLPSCVGSAAVVGRRSSVLSRTRNPR